MKKRILLLLFFFPLVLIAQEYTVGSIPNPKTADANNYVSNPDGILDSSSVAEINSMLVSLEADTHAEVAVVLVNSIGNEEMEHFAVKLFEEWGVGKKKIDNGLLILFVMDQRAITFEVGYGLEGVITDALSKRIQMQTMLPYFKEGDYGTGIIEGVRRVDSLIREEPVPEYEEEPRPSWQENFLILAAIFIGWTVVAILLVAIFAAIVKNNAKLKSNHDRYSAMKKDTTAINTTMVILAFVALFIGLFAFMWFYSFFFVLLPVALTPAYGIAKRIQKQFRSQPIPCTRCSGTMHILSETEDNKYLNPPQDFEEKLKSVDYDVFVCDKCRDVKIFTYDDPHSPYQVCSKCGTKALKKRKAQVVRAATYASTGTERVYYRCEYCKNEETRDVVIPIKQRSDDSGGGGFGGGSSSRSSGGSFGGGRSGGGGATSRW